MNQPPYGYGPVPPGRRPGPPPPAHGRPYGPPQGYGYPPNYGPPPGYPPAYGAPQGHRPPPIPYGPPVRPPHYQPPRKSGGSTWVILLLVVVFVVAGALVRNAFSAGRDSSAGPGRSVSAMPDGPIGPSETGNNPLLTDTSATLLPARCAYAPWGTQVDTARRFFETAAGCLETAWKPVLDKANLPFQPPTLNVSASTAGITTPCTGASNNFAAFYCPANRTIYMPINQLQTELFRDNWVVYLSVFAHEYGHHVQAVSGILRRANSERVDAGTRSERGLELSRRIELQANCFDGMYLASSSGGGSLTNAQIGIARRDAYARGDQPGDMRDHGSAQHGGMWFEQGLEKNRTAQCNTFTAPSNQVS